MIVPSVALPPAIAFTLQVTPVPAAPETAAVKTCAAPVGTLAVDGKTETATLSCNVTVADPLSFGLAWLTAVTVALGGLGMLAGAV